MARMGHYVLQRLCVLTSICLHTGEGSSAAPAALQQMRYSVLHCIGQLAGTGTRHSVWRGMTDKLAEAIAVYLDTAQTSAVKEAAAQVNYA